jgi:glutamyl-tRNA reductase
MAVEMAVISTCNRLELYVVTAAEPDDDLLHAWFFGLLPRSHAGLAAQLTVHDDEAAVEHLLRVASGLESMVLGEPHILEQLVDAFELARRCGTAGPSLAQLFQHAVRVGQRARAELDLDGRAVFLSRAAMHFFSRRHPELAQGNVLIVGAGKLAHLVAQALRPAFTQSIAVANRTPEPAEALARQVGGQTFPWHQMRTALVWADVVITATAAHHPIVDDNDIAAVLPQRRHRPLLLIDMGLPRNIHPAATGMAGVSYYDLDDLQAVLADLAHAESAHAVALPRWVAAQPAVRQVVQGETAALWARLSPNRPAG